MKDSIEPILDLMWIEKDCWTRIERGATSYKDVFHLPVFSTHHHHSPSSRIVVLRKANAVKREIIFHTDVRSDKVKHIANNPAVQFLFYHPDDRIQIRLSGWAVVESTTEQADEAWNKSRTSSRKCYLAEKGSGEMTDHPEDAIPVVFEGRDPDWEESEAGRENFCIVISTIHQMEWVWLNHKGHRRARFQYDSTGVNTNWLIP